MITAEQDRGPVGWSGDPAYTPSAVAVSGNVTLEDLRRVFPGY